MAKKKPRPRSIHGDGSGWNWAIVRRKPAPPSGLEKAITKVITWFWIDANRYRSTERRRGRRHMARLHPHRYRRREYPRS